MLIVSKSKKTGNRIFFSPHCISAMEEVVKKDKDGKDQFVKTRLLVEGNWIEVEDNAQSILETIQKMSVQQQLAAGGPNGKSLVV